MDISNLLCRAIDEAVEPWKLLHDKAIQVRDLEEVIRIAVLTNEMLTRKLKEDWKTLYSGVSMDTQGIAEATHERFARIEQTFSGVRRLINETREAGYIVDNVDKFEEAASNFARVRADFMQRWPYFDPAEIAIARAQAERGETIPIEDLIRELQG